jgi:hypothetical protein
VIRYGPRPRLGVLDRVIAVALLAVVLAGCAPLARFSTDTLNSQMGDSASLSFVTATMPHGLEFDPGSSTALGVKINAQGDQIANYPADVCKVVTYGVTCTLGDVEKPYFVSMTGKHVTATATYRRSGSNRVYQELATEP